MVGFDHVDTVHARRVHVSVVTGPFLIGLDAGHSVTKAAVIDSGGRLLGLATESAPVDAPAPRRRERDMHRVAESATRSMAAALSASGIDPALVVGIGIAGHGDGLYPVDGRQQPVRPAILATDTRAHVYAKDAAAAADADELLRLTGQPSVPYAAPALLRWLRDHEPEEFNRIAVPLNCKDWIRLTLTGVVATDPTDAAAAFTDLVTGARSERALTLTGLTELTGRLPVIIDSTAVAGVLIDRAAAATGLGPGTPVVTGAHDVHAAALGVGALTPDRVSVVLGTFNINQVVRTVPHLDTAWQVRPTLRPGAFLLMSTSPAGATAADWVREVTGGRDVAGAVASALSRSARPDDPLFLPFVHGSSLDPDPGGALAGARSWHGPDDLLRAALEGVVFTHRWHLELLAGSGTMTTAPVRLAGGGTRSPAWTQLLADATGLSVEVAEAPEAGALGAAMLAGIGTGVFADPDAAIAACVRVVRRQHPNDEVTELLDARYQRWLDTVSALQGVPQPD